MDPHHIHQDLDHLMTLTKTRSWVSLVAVGILLLAVILWSFLGDIPIKINARGVLLKGRGLVNITAPYQGLVVDVRVQPGQMFSAGHDLVVISQTDRHRQLIDLLKQSSRLNTEFFRLDDDTRHRQLEKRLQENSKALKEFTVNVQREERVIAQQDGKVSEVFINPGQFVERGDSLFSYYRTPPATDENLWAILYVSAEESKFVKNGIPVNISPGTYHKIRHGVLKGTISSVIRFPATRQGMMSLLNNEELVNTFLSQSPVIPVQVVMENNSGSLDQSSFNNPQYADLNGALCEANITISRKRPISYLFPGLR